MVAALDQVFKDHWSSVLANLVGFLGDIDLAEEATQEAFTVAAASWEANGAPTNPRAWLMTTARNRAIDHIRREKVGLQKLQTLQSELEVEHLESSFRDERLELIFTCCHPALSTEAQVALTLRALGGLSTAAIARAFLVPEATMAQRLHRAKAKIKATAIPFRVPRKDILQERLAAVLATVYLIFNEGYSGGREELADNAIWLGRSLLELLSNEADVHGLLALMLFNESRRSARYVDGEMVLLADQDQSLWNQQMIEEGRHELGRAIQLGTGSYVFQAQIAALHAESPPNWSHIAVLYAALEQITESPIVALNRAAAVAEAGDLEAALAITDSVPLHEYLYWHSTRAEVLRRLGRLDESKLHYKRALELSTDNAERRFLERRIGDGG